MSPVYSNIKLREIRIQTYMHLENESYFCNGRVLETIYIYTHTHTYIYIYIYIVISVCVCVCVCVCFIVILLFYSESSR